MNQARRYKIEVHNLNKNEILRCWLLAFYFQGPPGPPGPPGQPGPAPGQENLNALQRAIDSMEEKGMQEDPRWVVVYSFRTQKSTQV